MTNPIAEARKKLRKETSLRIQSPVCEFQYPALGTPNMQGDYAGMYGKYKVTLVLDPVNVPSHAEFIDKLRDRYTLALSMNPDVAPNDFPVRPQLIKAKYVDGYELAPGEDLETKVLTGKMTLTISEPGGRMNAERQDVLNSVTVYGPNNKLMTTEEKDALWSGTTGEVMLNTYAYNEAKSAGLAVKFLAVRIHDARLAGDEPDPDVLFGPPLVDSEGAF